jgi:hypothetical protein
MTILLLFLSGCSDNIDRSDIVESDKNTSTKRDVSYPEKESQAPSSNKDLKSISHWGAKCGRENSKVTTKAFISAKDSNKSILLEKDCRYYLDINDTLELKWSSLKGENSAI